MKRQNMVGQKERVLWKGTGVKMAAVGLIAVLFTSGCTRQTGVQESSAEQTEESTQETTVVVKPEGPEMTRPAEPDREPGTIAPFPGDAESESEEDVSEGEEGTEPEISILVGTDIHYLSRELTDGGNHFQYMVEHGDGKVVTYIEQITDAFLEEVIRRKPDVLILSGDLTLDGEKKSHEELAEKLYEVEDAGISVLVIPGNHDINNHHAAKFQGDERLPAEFTTPEEFREIYRHFGYDEALSEDKTSLSYVYEVDENTRFLMLDSCQYSQKALVGGVILSDTYDWIEEMLEEAWNDGVDMIPVAHHNLLDESEIYVDDCTIEHSEQLIRLLEDWDAPFFLSGHLHVQHTKQADDGRGIWEMVTSSLATPACQFGEISYWHGGSFSYKTDELDVEAWAKRHNRKETDLLEFNTFKEPFLRRVFYNQSYDALSKVESLSEDQRVRMSNLYSDLNYHYYQGTAYKIKDAVEKNPDFGLWMDAGYESVLADYVQYIINDAKRDYNKVVERK
ncbi:MAG: metallophosphoesterase [Brotaphodocola sp.]